MVRADVTDTAAGVDLLAFERVALNCLGSQAQLVSGSQTESQPRERSRFLYTSDKPFAALASKQRHTRKVRSGGTNVYCEADLSNERIYFSLFDVRPYPSRRVRLSVKRFLRAD